MLLSNYWNLDYQHTHNAPILSHDLYVKTNEKVSFWVTSSLVPIKIEANGHQFNNTSCLSKYLFKTTVIDTTYKSSNLGKCLSINLKKWSVNTRGWNCYVTIDLFVPDLKYDSTIPYPPPSLLFTPSEWYVANSIRTTPVVNIMFQIFSKDSLKADRLVGNWIKSTSRKGPGTNYHPESCNVYFVVSYTHKIDHFAGGDPIIVKFDPGETLGTLIPHSDWIKMSNQKLFQIQTSKEDFWRCDIISNFQQLIGVLGRCENPLTTAFLSTGNSCQSV